MPINSYNLQRGYHLNRDPFFVSEYYRKVCVKSRKLTLKIAKFCSEGEILGKLNFKKMLVGNHIVEALCAV